MQSQKVKPFINLKKNARFLTLLLITIILVLSTAHIFPTKQLKQGSSLSAFVEHLDRRIPEMMAYYRIPGANIALVKNGKTVWSQAYGYADLETGQKMTTDTYLRVQSISKSITAWGVMKLVEQGMIDLEQPVETYLENWAFPESPFAEENITVRQLLTHNAGLPIGDFYNFYSPMDDSIPSLEESLINEALLMQEPGQSFSYSNVGYNLLELLIEEVTGRDFAEYMETEVLIPLGMERSSFNWYETYDPPVPIGYNLTGKAIPVYVYPEKGSGGLFASIEDIAIFSTAGMLDYSHQSILAPDSINQLYTPNAKNLGMYSLVFDAYGMGHYIENLPGDIQAFSHGGQGTGWMSHFYSIPKTGDGIVILTNSQRSWPFFAYIFADWTEWSGLPPVGMEKVVTGLKLLWGFIGLIWLAVLWQLSKIGEDFIYKKRSFAPLSTHTRFSRVIQAILAFTLVSVLIWCLNQDYLFITSIFPIGSIWLGYTAFAIALTLIISALLPIINPNDL
jgi:CubicO group peptidase (beta-lactamase class C family)